MTRIWCDFRRDPTLGVYILHRLSSLSLSSVQTHIHTHERWRSSVRWGPAVVEISARSTRSVPLNWPTGRRFIESSVPTLRGNIDICVEARAPDRGSRPRFFQCTPDQNTTVDTLHCTAEQVIDTIHRFLFIHRINVKYTPLGSVSTSPPIPPCPLPTPTHIN